MERKGFGPRLGAALIDAVIMIAVAGILGLIFMGHFVASYGMPTKSTVTTASAGTVMVYSLIVGLIGLAYFATEIFMAASPGHMILKMKIMREDGTPADQATLIKRFVIRRSPQIISLLAALPFLAFLGYLNMVLSILILVSCFMTLRANKLALHDEWSGTAVYGPGTAMVPQGFPVQPLNTGVNAPPPTTPVG